MKLMKFFYYGAYALYLFFPLIMWIDTTLPQGGGIGVNGLSSAREVLATVGQNAKIVMGGMVDFIPNLITGVKQNVDETPPPDTAIGRPYMVGFVELEKEKVLREGDRTAMKFQITNPDTKKGVQAETKCRVTLKDDEAQSKDKNQDGFVDWEEPNWKLIEETPVLISSRTLFCPITSSDPNIPKTQDEVEIEYGAVFKIDQVATYTTYFMEEVLDEASVKIPYETPEEFFKDKFGLDQVPVSESRNDPCSISMNNADDLPPIGVRRSDPNFYVPFVLGFEAKQGYGESTLKSIENLKIETSPGVAKILCDEERVYFNKEGNTFVLDASKSKKLEGKKIRLDCKMYMDNEELIWTDDYSQTSFRATATCVIQNSAKMTARILRESKPSGTVTTPTSNGVPVSQNPSAGLIPTGTKYLSQERVSRFLGSYTPTGYSSSLENLAKEIAAKYGIEPELLAAVMVSESGVADLGPHCNGQACMCDSRTDGHSSLTGCAWPGGK